jgi:hypothetical protein
VSEVYPKCKAAGPRIGAAQGPSAAYPPPLEGHEKARIGEAHRYAACMRASAIALAAMIGLSGPLREKVQTP